MSKAILISDHAKWCAEIMNGNKTIEVRKNKALANAIQKLIDKYGYADIYVHCCKDNKQRLYPVALLDKSNQVFKRAYREDKIDNRTNYLNGKVAFKFRCYKVEEVLNPYFTKNSFIAPNLIYEDLLKWSCLNENDLDNYLPKGKKGCAIHISDLEIFDKPKELSEFYKGFKRKYYKNHFAQDIHKEKDALVQPIKCGYEYTYSLTKAPQNFCYVEVEQ